MFPYLLDVHRQIKLFVISGSSAIQLDSIGIKETMSSALFILFYHNRFDNKKTGEDNHLTSPAR